MTFRFGISRTRKRSSSDAILEILQRYWEKQTIYVNFFRREVTTKIMSVELD